MLSAIPLLAGLVLAHTPSSADSTAFQQGVAYRIEARLDEGTDVLSGRMRMRYTNHSAQRLDTLYFHLSLNAFRPNSAWAQRELQFGQRRFQDLGPRDYAFQRLRRVRIDGRAVTTIFPGAPDSTVVALPLAQPLGPGDSLIVDMDWDARLSTIPRREGRRGRHYDFAQWYPKVAVFDQDGWEVRALLPQGEFYGEFASYDVTLDVAQDQVMGATGIPVEGDPGWAAAAADPGAVPDLRRDFYPPRPAEALGFLRGNPARGRKRVRWRSMSTHHFAWSTDPHYIYEGGHYKEVAIHVLYQPGDTSWAHGTAVRNTATALAWEDSVFGTFAWPQLTNVHRIEGGGTEFPMMVMNGGAGLGLVIHEVGHNYVMGILANNEWKSGWLDEGFTSFVTSWYVETHGGQDVWRGAMRFILQRERAGTTQPIATPGADFRDFGTYNAMTYTKPSLVYRMLRYVMGEDAFRAALHDYYTRNKLHHVREEDLRASMERFHGDLGWFFHEWLHTTATLDYRVGEVHTEPRADGLWQTQVEVLRDGDIFMPVTLRVGAAELRLDSRARRQVLQVITLKRPQEVVLDPDNVLIDLEPANNVYRF